MGVALRLRPTRGLVCREVVELLTEYLDGALSSRDRRRVDRHLRGCPNCTRYLEQLRAAIATMHALPEETLSDDARDELVEAFRAWRGGRPA
jgi:anti-sigma factor RsiW